MKRHINRKKLKAGSNNVGKNCGYLTDKGIEIKSPENIECQHPPTLYELTEINKNKGNTELGRAK